MRTYYQPISQKAWEDFLQADSQVGGAIVGFRGARFQRGAGLGSIFSGLFRTLFPILKTVGKTVGKQALTTGAQVASDVLAGQEIKQALENRGKEAGKNLLQKGIRHLQKGQGLGVRPKRKSIKGRKSRKAVIVKKRKVTDQLGSYFV